jgi:cysteine desulfuration protein SufE
VEKIEQIIEDFNFFDNWEDKYEYLVDIGRNLPSLDEEMKKDEYKLKGCQSTVYFLTKENSNGTLKFLADSDAFIVRGLISILIEVFSDKTPKEILNTDINFLNEIGLQNHLSPTRKNGLSSMLEKIKQEASLRV